MFDMPTILVAYLPSDQLLWVKAASGLDTVCAVRLGRWDLKGDILLMHPEKLPS